MNKKTSLTDQVEFFVLLTTATLAAIVSLLDFFGLLSGVDFLQKHIANITLLLICAVSAYLALERRNKLDKLDSGLQEKTLRLEQNLDKGIEHVIASLQGVSAGAYSDRKAFWDAVKASLARAEKQIDVTRLRPDESAAADYYDLLKDAVKRGVRLRRVIVFQKQAMVEQAHNEMVDLQGPYYHLGVYDVGWQELPPVMNFIIIDDKEVFAGGGYMSPEYKSVSFGSNHPALVQSFSHYFDSLWQRSNRVHNEDELDRFLMRAVPTLGVLPGYEETYKISMEIARSSTNHRLWVTGFAPNLGNLSDEFDLVVAQRLKEKREIEYKSVIAIHSSADIERQISCWKKLYYGTNYLERVIVGMPYLLDVFISDEEELLIGVTAREASEGYTNCLRIREPSVVRAVADWYSTHLWPNCIEIIGKSGPNEAGIAEVQRRLAMQQTHGMD